MEKAKAAYTHLVEKVSEFDDQLMEKYLEGKPVSELELVQGIRKATLTGKFCAVLCGSAYKNKGVQPLLDAVCTYLPAPMDMPPTKATDVTTGELVAREPKDDAPFSALAFKIQVDPRAGGRRLSSAFTNRHAPPPSAQSGCGSNPRTTCSNAPGR